MNPFSLLGFTESESMVLWVVISNKKPITQKELGEKTNLSVGMISSTLSKGIAQLGLESTYDPIKKSTVFFATHLFREKTHSIFLRNFLETLKRAQTLTTQNSEGKSKIKSTSNPQEESENTRHIGLELTQSIDWIERSISLSKWK